MMASSRNKWRMAAIGVSGTAVLAPVLLIAGTSSASPIQNQAIHAGHYATLHAGVRLGAMSDAVHRGRRVFAGGVTHTTDSTNWSGYGGPSGGYIGAEGTWTVPSVATSAANLYSSSWVGVDGLNNSWLIQTGTDQDSSSAGSAYDAWFEIITPSDEAPSTPLDDAPVAPGDAMTAVVAEVSSGNWEIYLADATQEWYFNSDFTYYGPAASAEWIEEAPTFNSQQSSPADWGTAEFSGTGIYDGNNWYSTGMSSGNAIDMVDNNDKILAAPGPISAGGDGGQFFADVWGTPAPPPPPPITAPSSPTSIAAKAQAHAIKVTWAPPAHAGGRPINHYIVRELRGGVLYKTINTTSRTYTASGLTTSWRYSFKVAASNRTYISAFSAATAPIHALK